MTDLKVWQDIFDAKARELYPAMDPAHDFLHIRRVVATALKLAREELADVMIVLPAAYFHDFIAIPKDDPRRTQASTLSGEAAVLYLRDAGYPAHIRFTSSQKGFRNNRHKILRDTLGRGAMPRGPRTGTAPDRWRERESSSILDATLWGCERGCILRRKMGGGEARTRPVSRQL